MKSRISREEIINDYAEWNECRNALEKNAVKSSSKKVFKLNFNEGRTQDIIMLDISIQKVPEKQLRKKNSGSESKHKEKFKLK